jgi:pimeloyl-ACP methyl ester carboxylesterase
VRPRGWLALAGIAVAGALAQELAARRYYASTPGPDRFFHDDEQRAWTPLWREGFAAAEWLSLLASPIYRGDGVARGDGAPVVLVQGFLTKGAYLSPLRRWLERMGYRADIADIGWNAECLDVLADRLTRAVRRTADATGREVHLVGHSLGGLLARATAARARDHVASIVTLGSPFRGFRIHPVLQLAARLVRSDIHRRRGRTVPEECFTLACDCDTARSLATPLPPDLPQTSIVTRADGFTDWRYCSDPEPARVVEVAASHIGMVVNATVYRVLAEHLAASAVAPTRC